MDNLKERVVRGFYSFYFGKNELYRIDISARKECKAFITGLYVRVNYYNERSSRLFFSDYFWVSFPRITVNSWGNRRKEPLKLHFINDCTIRNGTKLAKWAEYTVNCANESLGLSPYVLSRFQKDKSYLLTLLQHIHESGYPFSNYFLPELDSAVTEYSKTKDLHYKVEILTLVRNRMKDKLESGEEVNLYLKNINVPMMLLQRNRNKAKYQQNATK